MHDPRVVRGAQRRRGLARVLEGGRHWHPAAVRRRLARLSPSRYSITMYETPVGSVPKSSTSTMPGWWMALAARASLKNRVAMSVCRVKWGGEP